MERDDDGVQEWPNINHRGATTTRRATASSAAKYCHTRNNDRRSLMVWQEST